VQGVFFRGETQDRARTRGLGGWVRNLQDGSVEAVFEGPRDAVERMIDWCEQGPRGARVDRVRVRWEDPLGEDGFGIR
jgi:acylphosphatase